MSLPVTSVVQGGTLTESEARTAMEAILESRASQLETAAFLTALATRAGHGAVETAEELVGFARALEARMIPVAAPTRTIDTCGTGGSGRAKLNVSTLAAIALAACGEVVAKHGNRSSVAVGSSDVLEQAGVPLPGDPVRARARAERTLEETRLAFLHAPQHHPALASVAPIRKTLGFRTAFNLLGPLGSPARVRRQLVGVSDPARVGPMAAALATLGRERAVVFGGSVDELVLEAPAVGLEVQEGLVHGALRLDPREHGVLTGARGEVRAGLDGFLDVLEARSERAVELVAWNAGVALAVARARRDLGAAIAGGVAEARDALVSGRARLCFESHRALVRALEPTTEAA